MLKINDYYNPGKGTEVSSINIDPNLVFAIFIFLAAIVIIILFASARNSRLDKKIINQKPIWHDIDKQDEIEPEEKKTD